MTSEHRLRTSISLCWDVRLHEARIEVLSNPLLGIVQKSEVESFLRHLSNMNLFLSRDVDVSDARFKQALFHEFGIEEEMGKSLDYLAGRTEMFKE